MQIGARWLLEWTERAGMQPEVATAAAKTVLMGGSNDEVAAELFDLVGDSGFEAIQELVAYRCSAGFHTLPSYPSKPNLQPMRKLGAVPYLYLVHLQKSCGRVQGGPALFVTSMTVMESTQWRAVTACEFLGILVPDIWRGRLL